MQIKVRFSDMSTATYTIIETGNIMSIKQKIVEDNRAIYPDQVRVIFMGRVLQNTASLADVGITGDSLVQVMISQPDPEILASLEAGSEVNQMDKINNIITDPKFLRLMKEPKFLELVHRFMENPSLVDGIGMNTDDNPGNYATMYSNELDLMYSMGLVDTETNIRYLQEADGNVQVAIDNLFMGLN